MLDVAMKNRTGHIANDFTYTLLNGKTGTLHAIQADYTLLFFKDPECEDCLHLTKQLIASPVITNHIRKQTLKVITVYTGDNLTVWKKHASEVADTWIYSNNADQKINTEMLYVVNHFPTLYLLDKDKRVLLKDTSFEKLENYFSKQ
jgi:thioredoxin-related protein